VIVNFPSQGRGEVVSSAAVAVESGRPRCQGILHCVVRFVQKEVVAFAILKGRKKSKQICTITSTPPGEEEKQLDRLPQKKKKEKGKESSLAKEKEGRDSSSAVSPAKWMKSCANRPFTSGNEQEERKRGDPPPSDYSTSSQKTPDNSSPSSAIFSEEGRKGRESPLCRHHKKKERGGGGSHGLQLIEKCPRPR